ncbi:hypothetical protein C4571_02125 [Candidatus Parcubacteria bacterium]|nr:MAG: hypothetical protein C4571_02125 [Candidatus Parcubacteria bacterium]
MNATAPIDINGAGASSDVFSMENFSHATIIVQLGVTGAATTITVKECDDVTPTNSTAIAFYYYSETTAAGDTLSTRTAATTSGITGSTNDGVMYVIEIDASQLTDGYKYLQVCASDPSAATLYSCVAILSGSRYSGDPATEAITAIV